MSRQQLPYTAQLLPTLAAFGGCEYRERRLGQTAFVVFRKMLIISDSALVEIFSVSFKTSSELILTGAEQLFSPCLFGGEIIEKSGKIRWRIFNLFSPYNESGVSVSVPQRHAQNAVGITPYSVLAPKTSMKAGIHVKRWNALWLDKIYLYFCPSTSIKRSKPDLTLVQHFEKHDINPWFAYKWALGMFCQSWNTTRGHVALASFLTLFFDLAIFTMAECGGTKRLCRPNKRQKEIPIYS